MISSWTAALLLVASTCLVSTRGFRVLRGDDQPDIAELHFSNYDSLIRVAALFGESVVVPLTGETQTIITQHGVNLLLDCESLFAGVGKPLGAKAQWVVHRFLQEPDGLLTLRSSSFKIQSGVRDRIEATGNFDRFLNITSTNILQASEDADHGVYTCTACSASGCQSTSATIFILGTPFQQVQNGTAVAGKGVDRSFNIGTDFCVEAGSNETILLRCDVVPLPFSNNVIIPGPSRTWTMDDTEVYKVGIGGSPFGSLNPELFANSILQYGAVNPPALIPRKDGSLRMGFAASQLLTPSLAPGTSAETVKEDVFEALIGTWSCTVSTPFQTMTATSVISQC